MGGGVQGLDEGDSLSLFLVSSCCTETEGALMASRFLPFFYSYYGSNTPQLGSVWSLGRDSYVRWTRTGYWRTNSRGCRVVLFEGHK
jgi:hypothetical protein